MLLKFVGAGINTAVDNVSKQDSFSSIKDALKTKVDLSLDDYRFYGMGKQIEDQLTPYHYKLQDGHTIMVMKVVVPPADKPMDVQEEKEVRESASSLYFEVNSKVDARHQDGTWYEATVVGIYKRSSDLTYPAATTTSHPDDDGLSYDVKYEKFEDDVPTALCLSQIRPRATELIPLVELKQGDIIFCNLNLEEGMEKTRGFWYDVRISRAGRELRGDVFASEEEILDRRIYFTDELFKIIHPSEDTKKLTLKQEQPVLRTYPPNCQYCLDNENKPRCKECGCQKCYKKDHPEAILVCDECDDGYHKWCLNPPLEKIPDDDWYCHNCKLDTSAIAEKVKKTQSSVKYDTTNCKRDWGKGFATAGRTKTCTTADVNHFGPIPGVEVGQSWKFRIQASEAGVHRPPVSGMHGTEKHGAFSIVLAGGYEDDEDKGNSFIYTGSGGRDLSGNKRTAGQSSDQLLTRTNKALAMNCNVKLSEKGGEADNWKKGKPVRVLRSFKGQKHSKYAPKEGVRYDGIYKVKRYWPEKGKSGFSVWKYEMVRDDETPAPWTPEGKKRIEELGLAMIVPDTQKRPAEEDLENKDPKRQKICYKPPDEVLERIEKDAQNKVKWDDCKGQIANGVTKFTDRITSYFECAVCLFLSNPPVTTPCGHTGCMPCLKKSIDKTKSCPECRHALHKDDLEVNDNLKTILELLNLIAS